MANKRKLYKWPSIVINFGNEISAIFDICASGINNTSNQQINYYSNEDVSSCKCFKYDFLLTKSIKTLEKLSTNFYGTLTTSSCLIIKAFFHWKDDENFVNGLPKYRRLKSLCTDPLIALNISRLLQRMKKTGNFLVQPGWKRKHLVWKNSKKCNSYCSVN